MAADSKQNTYKLVVLGAGAVGKSSLTVRYVTGDFLEEYDPTIEDYYRKLIKVDDKPAYLDILDTAGQEEFSSMQDEFFRQGKGFLLIYSIISRESFEHTKVLVDKIRRAKDDPDEKLALILCGNKCDLNIQRKVPKDEGQKLAKEFGCPFFETSAKEKINNAESFEQCVREIRKLEENTGQKKKESRGFCNIL
mmetsp:Transcript_5357/g.8774  ORF Transcript_5357/g.8774 Transcript_5357/m.8774 type:complete len:194 (+) Transcript_5357:47-628(+)|eukprot:CAMPEP_0202704182 /NCGR_PEP_ID=MMETSP1385-20130828/16913_1 /ASSEMBLY_ACC=CAM_ASM_000861 /TAXON_ID=933848 /ORGANISM="Elphidium margaritaceum" /LENGTH=193 /DNA_ID=CAMNT_0049362153 /DNA_START=46 /DNA_END=627 /DNA_ORIENTATION=-